MPGKKTKKFYQDIIKTKKPDKSKSFVDEMLKNRKVESKKIIQG